MHTRLYAISIDSLEQSQALATKLDLPFDLLCDPSKEVIKTFGVFNPHEHGGLAYPAIFIVNREGQIVFRSLDKTYHRVDLNQVLNFLKEFSQNPEHRSSASDAKAFQKVGPKTLWRAGMNLFRNGDMQDWLFILGLPLSIPYRLLFKKKRKKD